MYLLAENLPTPVAILLTILFVVVAAGLCVLLYFSIKKERNRYISEKLKAGVMDKNGFDEMLRRKFYAANKDTHFTVMIFELASAENTRQTYGNKQYETLINLIIERIGKVLPRLAKICHYDYDTIVAFIEEDMDKKLIADMSEFCIKECIKPISTILRVDFVPEVSLGVVSYSEFSNTFDIFKLNLDSALASSRRRGINEYTIYSQELVDNDTEEYRYYQEIKSAIEAKEFCLYYQPIYNMYDRRIIGYETLLRWNHRTLGVLSPAKFLSIMEQTGDINWVGVWAFEQLVITQAKYRETHPDEQLIFSMNISNKQLSNPSFVEDFRRVLKKYHAQPECICLEIDEYTVFDKKTTVQNNIERLRQSGFMLAVDDFGLEMSALKKLDSSPVNWIKLGRVFIEDIKDDFMLGNVVTSLVAFATSKSMIVIAEGIEDDVTVDYLKVRGITFGQGYFYGKPLPPESYGI